MDPKNDCGFHCIKVLLLIIYVLTAIVATVALITTSIDLSSINKAKTSYTPDKYAHLTRNGTEAEQLAKSETIANAEANEITRSLVVTALVITIIALVTSLIGLVGVIKENLSITIILTVLSAVEVIVYFVIGIHWSACLWPLFVAILSGLYAHMIRMKTREYSGIIN